MRVRRAASRASRRLTVAAVALAVVGGLAFQRYVEDLEAGARPGGAERPAVVASRSLPRGATIAPEDVRVVAVPERFVPPGTASRIEAVAGRTLLAPIAAGEPVTSTRLGPRAGPVAALVPYGLRAVALTTALPAGTVVAGDRVDVLATFATAAPHTETVIEGAEVLEVLRPDASFEGAATTLVLLVSTGDAERLAYARAFADLSVAIAPG